LTAHLRNATQPASKHVFCSSAPPTSPESVARHPLPLAAGTAVLHPFIGYSCRWGKPAAEKEHQNKPSQGSFGDNRGHDSLPAPSPSPGFVGQDPAPDLFALLRSADAMDNSTDRHYDLPWHSMKPAPWESHVLLCADRRFHAVTSSLLSRSHRPSSP
jgi:hypothetical protein